MEPDGAEVDAHVGERPREYAPASGAVAVPVRRAVAVGYVDSIATHAVRATGENG